LPKLRLDGLTLAFGAITVALTGIDCGLPGALSVKVMTAETAPVLLGYRLSVSLQVLPGERELLHPLSRVRSLEVAPIRDPKLILVNLMVEVPLFVRVTVRELPPHSVTVPKLTLEGDQVRPAITVRIEAGLTTLPFVAVMLLASCATPMARPPGVIEAFEMSEEFQVTVLVMF
jgi:hypothetical protein